MGMSWCTVAVAMAIAAVAVATASVAPNFALASGGASAGMPVCTAWGSGRAVGGAGLAAAGIAPLRLKGGVHKQHKDREQRHKDRDFRQDEEFEIGGDLEGDENGDEDDAFAEHRQQLDELHRKAVGLMEGHKPKQGKGDWAIDEKEAGKEEGYDEDERFSYQKQAEKEMRRAEEAEAERQRLNEEYLEKRRRGEIQSSTEEVRDTLRWGDDDQASRQVPPPAFDEDMPVADWLTEQRLEQYIPLFEEEGWDTMGAVASLTERDLVEMGVKRGHVRRILLALKPPPQKYGSVAYRRRSHPDDDVDVKPYSVESNSRGQEQALGRLNRTQKSWQDEPVHTSVRTRFGPGGASKLADAGGLGAFLCGSGDIEGEEEEEEEEDYVPRHRRLQQQKEEIVDRLKRKEHLAKSR